MLISNLCHFYSKDASDVTMNEGVQLEIMMFFDGPVFTTPEQDVEDVLNKDLVFESQLDILVVEEMSESSHLSTCLCDSVLNVEVFR